MFRVQEIQSRAILDVYRSLHTKKIKIFFLCKLSLLRYGLKTWCLQISYQIQAAGLFPWRVFRYWQEKISEWPTVRWLSKLEVMEVWFAAVHWLPTASILRGQRDRTGCLSSIFINIQNPIKWQPLKKKISAILFLFASSSPTFVYM